MGGKLRRFAFFALALVPLHVRAAPKVGPGSFADGPVAGQRGGNSDIPDRAEAFKTKGKEEAERWSEDLGGLQWGATILGHGEVRSTVANIVGDLGSLIENPNSAMSEELFAAIGDPSQRTFVAIAIQSMVLAMPGEASAPARARLLKVSLAIMSGRMDKGEVENLRREVPKVLAELGRFLGSTKRSGYGEELKTLALKTFDEVAVSDKDGKREGLSTNFRMELVAKLGMNVAVKVGADGLSVGLDKLARETGLSGSEVSKLDLRDVVSKILSGRSKELGLSSPLTIKFYENARTPHTGSVRECLERSLSEAAMTSCVDMAQKQLEGQVAEWGLRNATFGTKIKGSDGKTVELPVDLSAHVRKAADAVYDRARRDGKLRSDSVPSPSLQIDLLAQTIETAARSATDEFVQETLAGMDPEMAASLQAADSALRADLISGVVKRLKAEAKSVEKLHDLTKLGSAKNGNGSRLEQILLESWGETLKKTPDLGTVPPGLIDRPEAYAKWRKDKKDPSVTNEERSLFESYYASMENASKKLAPKKNEASLKAYTARLDKGALADAAVEVVSSLRDQVWKRLDCAAIAEGGEAAIAGKLEALRLQRKQNREFCRAQQAKARDKEVGPLMRFPKPGQNALEPPPHYAKDASPLHQNAEGAIAILNFACQTGRKECLDLVDRTLQELPQTLREAYAGQSLSEAPMRAVTSLLQQEKSRNYAFTACLTEGMLKQVAEDVASDIEINGWDARGLLKSVTDPVLTAMNVRRVLNDPALRPRLDAFVDSIAKGASETSLSEIGDFFSKKLAPTLVPTLTDLTARAFATPFASSKATDALIDASTKAEVGGIVGNVATGAYGLLQLLKREPFPAELQSACLDRSTQVAIAPWVLLATDQTKIYLEKTLRQGDFAEARGINKRLHPGCWGDQRTATERESDLKHISQIYGDAVVGGRSREPDAYMQQARDLAMKISPEPGRPVSAADAAAWIQTGKWTLDTYKQIQVETAPSKFMPQPKREQISPEVLAARQKAEQEAYVKSSRACGSTGLAPLTSTGKDDAVVPQHTPSAQPKR
jgi:hypothetical protein